MTDQQPKEPKTRIWVDDRGWVMGYKEIPHTNGVVRPVFTGEFLKAEPFQTFAQCEEVVRMLDLKVYGAVYAVREVEASVFRMDVETGEQTKTIGLSNRQEKIG